MTAVISFAKINIQADVTALSQDLQQFLSQEWLGHVNKKAYKGKWNVLPLRCAKPYLELHPILQAFSIEAESEWVDLPALQNCLAINQALSQICCPIKSVRLMRLEKGAEISPHRDVGLCLERGHARLQLPIIMPEQVCFYVGGEQVPMRAGELWYINADECHCVQNNSTEDRVSLVIDCEVNDWLLKQVA